MLRLVENTVIDSTEVLQSTNLDLNGFSLSTVMDIEASNITCGGGLITCRNLTVNNTFTADGDISASGDLTANKGLIFSNAQVTVGGNCQIDSRLKMTNANDYLLVNGNLTTSLKYNESDYLSAGTVEVKGDFADQYDGGGNSSSYRYWETGTHKTIFSGSGVQQISFYYPQMNRFENPYFRNQHINFTTGINKLRLVENTVIDSTEVLEPTTLDLNGFSLATLKDVEAVNLTCSGAMFLCRNLTVTNPFNVDGIVSACGDLTVSRLIFNNARVIVGGNCQINEKLVMTHTNDLLFVEGNLTTSLKYNGSDDLSAGTVEVKGDFADQYDGGGNSSSYRYWETGTHKTIFSGSGVQQISFYYPQKNRFATLILRNRSQEGVVFNSPVKVGTLFDHNRCAFALFDNGNGSSFNDFDGDGLLDHQDDYPTIPYPAVCGDANGDSRININDVTAIQRHLADIEPLTDVQLILADTNGDGVVNINDATHLQNYLAEFDGIVLGKQR